MSSFNVLLFILRYKLFNKNLRLKSKGIIIFLFKVFHPYFLLKFKKKLTLKTLSKNIIKNVLLNVKLFGLT